MRRKTLALAIAFSATAGAVLARPVPCWRDNGAVVVSAALGDIAGDFILDLSAPRSLLHETTAQGAGIASTAVRAPLRLAGRQIEDAALQVVDLDSRTRNFPTNISGVIGADVLDAYAFEIAAQPCRIALGRSTRRVWRERLPLRLIEGTPAVQATITDGTVALRGWFAIDTASFGIRLAASVAALDAPQGRAVQAPKLAALVLGTELFQNLPVSLDPQTSAGLAGAIGEAVWSRFDMRVDARRRALWLSVLDVAPQAPVAGVHQGREEDEVDHDR
jgi:hypothetical protein